MDPDILVGFEIQMLSWGYVIERGYQLGINITPQLCRVPGIVTGIFSYVMTLYLIVLLIIKLNIHKLVQD